jgi:proteic killer suppression protein
VIVEFHDRKLARDCLAGDYADERARMRAFGKERAKKVGRRLTSLLAAASLEELRNVPGRFHELGADRAGQFAADLDGPYRLIFVPIFSPEEQAVHAAGFVWSNITRVSILEITDYHG